MMSQIDGSTMQDENQTFPFSAQSSAEPGLNVSVQSEAEFHDHYMQLPASVCDRGVIHSTKEFQTINDNSPAES